MHMKIFMLKWYTCMASNVVGLLFWHKYTSLVGDIAGSVVIRVVLSNCHICDLLMIPRSVVMGNCISIFRNSPHQQSFPVTRWRAAADCEEPTSPNIINLRILRSFRKRFSIRKRIFEILVRYVPN